MKPFRIIIFFLLYSITAQAQDLLNSRQSSYYTYLFKISSEEAEKLHKRKNKKDFQEILEASLHTKIDSFHTDSLYTNTLSSGHYLKAWAEKGELKVETASVLPIEAKILDNDTDLLVRLYDLEGKIIDDAKVKLGMKKLRWDTKTKTYKDKKSGRKGMLSVSWKGQQAFYDVERQYNRSELRRKSNIALNSMPLYFVWRPVRYVIFLPYDGVWSVIRGYPMGTISKTINVSTNLFNNVACWFDDYYCDNYNRKKGKGYFVTNKPKYKPGDTVKVKAFIVNHKNKAVNKDLKLKISQYGKTKVLETLSPYKNGAYSTEFVLTDSLDLQLDRKYTLALTSKKGKDYLSTRFDYEEYELSKIVLDADFRKEIFYSEDTVTITVTGKDENDLNLYDARIEVLVQAKDILGFHNHRVFVPDTIHYVMMPLENSGETKISIPAEIFPEADLKLNAFIKLYTAENNTEETTISSELFKAVREIRSELQQDSLYFSFLENGDTVIVQAQVFEEDLFGNVSYVQDLTLPGSIKTDPLNYKYLVKVDSIESSLYLSRESAGIVCNTHRTHELIQIQVKNPRKIPFSWFLYKKNNEVDRGFSDSLYLEIPEKGTENYFISLQYVWGGETRKSNYKIPLNTGKLKLEVFAPDKVYPGQDSEFIIKVTDYKGKPVENTDLTAWSNTSKFEYTAPLVPDMGKFRRNKTVINAHHFADNSSEETLKLNYLKWNELTGLDSIEYFQFLYPGDSIYRYEYTPENGITQFSPFVIDEGKPEKILYVFVDSKPVYFGWLVNPSPYSFEISPGLHTVEIRTSQHKYTIRNIRFNKGKKLIFSIDSEANSSYIYRKLEGTFSLKSTEGNTVQKYLMFYRNNWDKKMGYIQQGSRYTIMNIDRSNRYSTWADAVGPIYPSEVNFEILEGFKHDFDFEPGFEYDINEKLIKMRQRSYSWRSPYNYYGDNASHKSFTDEVFTKQKITQIWQEYLDDTRFSHLKYRYPKTTEVGKGSMLIQLDIEEKETAPINFLLFRYDDPDFMRVYPGNRQQYENLSEGIHKLILFYKEESYAVYDSLNLQPNGLNFFDLKHPEILEKDSFSISVSEILEKNVYQGSNDDYFIKKEIVPQYRKRFTYSGPGQMISGYIYDSSGEPLPGASVIAKGTTLGTNTDLNGYYEMKVPSGVGVLVYSFIGFQTQEKAISSQMDIEMTEDIQQLQEIVVVGYGVQSKRALTGAVQVVGGYNYDADVAGSLAGRVAGVSITRSSPGAAPTIKIRGTSAVSFDSEPLYVIDGVVYSGMADSLDLNSIHKVQILKDAAATAIYGARGANGVVIISTNQSSGDIAYEIGSNPQKEEDAAFFGLPAEANSIRNNFSDDAFWQPRLITNKEGIVKFSAKFPDDVTSWNTYYLAMNGKRQSGQTSGLVKSYKPLMAQLAVPSFLIEGDSISALGKLLNYSPEGQKVNINFTLNDQTVFENSLTVEDSHIDTLHITATPNDTLKAKYSLTKEDGYLDGELREIPVYKQGMEKSEGWFWVLNNDTTFTVDFDSAFAEEIHLYAKSDELDIWRTDINRLKFYRYSCNEQKASRMMALIYDDQARQWEGKKPVNKRAVQRLIKQLFDDRNEDGLWGWFANSESLNWVTVHVLKALNLAISADYHLVLDSRDIVDPFIFELERAKNAKNIMDVLQVLQAVKAPVNFQSYLAKADTLKNISDFEKLRVLEMKQQLGINNTVSALDSFRRETLYGNVYYSVKNNRFDIRVNDLQSTLIAYRILRADSTTDHSMELLKMRNYFLEKRMGRYYWNTYEMAGILMTIMPDMLKGKKEFSENKLILETDEKEVIERFPYENTLSGKETLRITKTGDFPIYFGAWQQVWDTQPEIKSEDFVVKTWFNDSTDLQNLEAGKEAVLHVELVVKKDADYVMLSVPIPAGCSYTNKKQHFWQETHREYFKDEVAIYTTKLKEGTYSYEIKLMPRFSGSFTMNPAKAELMYFPMIYGNTESKHLTIH